MGCHVGHPGRMTCRSGRGSCVRGSRPPPPPRAPGPKGRDPSDPHVATGEGSEAVDGIPRACVAGGLGLEQRQRPLRTVGGPHGQHSPVVLAQRQGTRRAFHTRDCPIAGSGGRPRLHRRPRPGPATDGRGLKGRERRIGVGQVDHATAGHAQDAGGLSGAEQLGGHRRYLLPPLRGRPDQPQVPGGQSRRPSDLVA
jgi:hypothetical protein